jgi:hypothetical protein
MHMVDLTTPGDAMCTGDRGGMLRRFTTMFPGFNIRLDLAGAFVPLAVGDDGSEDEFDAHYPVTIKKGPLGRLWVIDEAEFIRSNGTVYILNPNDPTFGVQVVR